MRTAPLVTDEEVKSLMDFDALLKERNKVSHARRKFRNIKYLLVGFGVIVTLPLGIFFFHPSQQPAEKFAIKKAPAKTSPTLPTDTLDNGPEKEEHEALDKKSPVPPLRQERAPMPATREEKQAGPEMSGEPARVSPVYVQAEPVDGYPALYRYFRKNLVYPAAAVKDSVQGVVNVVFAIDTNGKATNISIENSLGSLFDLEAIRLVQNMPLWKPATYNGKPVRSKISLPITFELSKTSNE